MSPLMYCGKACNIRTVFASLGCSTLIFACYLQFNGLNSTAMRILLSVLFVWVVLIIIGSLFTLVKYAIWIGIIALVIIGVQRLLQGRNLLTGEKN